MLKNIQHINLFLICLAVFLSPAIAQDRELDSLASHLGDQISRKGNKIVAVTNFANEKCSMALGQYVASRINIALVSSNEGFRVVTREKLDDAYRELQLKLSSRFNATTFGKIGQFTGADLIITGDFAIFGSKVELTAEILDVGTGLIIGGGIASLPRTNDIEALLTCSGGAEHSLLQSDVANAPSAASLAAMAAVPPLAYNNAPGGFAVSGGTLDHPTVNNYGPKPLGMTPDQRSLFVKSFKQRSIPRGLKVAIQVVAGTDSMLQFARTLREAILEANPEIAVDIAQLGMLLPPMGVSIYPGLSLDSYDVVNSPLGNAIATALLDSRVVTDKVPTVRGKLNEGNVIEIVLRAL